MSAVLGQFLEAIRGLPYAMVLAFHRGDLDRAGKGLEGFRETVTLSLKRRTKLVRADDPFEAAFGRAYKRLIGVTLAVAWWERDRVLGERRAEAAS